MQGDVRKAPIRLNIGCGHNRIEGYINIDILNLPNVDQVLDIRHTLLPFGDNSIDEILLFHTIEHIEEKYHKDIFKEFHRVLEPEGSLFISYPEFKVCAQYYIDNHRGMADFWKATIYGLQRTHGDYHVSLMDTEALIELLQDCGFYEIAYMPEKHEEWNTVLCAQKKASLITPDEVYENNLSRI